MGVCQSWGWGRWANGPHPQDPTNLEGKVQQQQAFEGELLANKGRIDTVIESAQELIRSGHHSLEVIDNRAKEIGELWAELEVLSADKGILTCPAVTPTHHPPPQVRS